MSRDMADERYPDEYRNGGRGSRGVEPRDLVLNPFDYAYILDGSKGILNVAVGPLKTSISDTDVPMILDEVLKKFVRCTIDQAVKRMVTAPEGWYVILKNPAVDNQWPIENKMSSLDKAKLSIGHKVNIPGPIDFAPWPGQMFRIVQGHRLRTNQYLVARVYDEKSAEANWNNTVVQPATDSESAETLEKPDFKIGSQFVIKGTEVSFYIPPTGIEVVKEGSNYVRDAVTLKQLEYCALLDENGMKRYVNGPDVVFPAATETFNEVNGKRQFKTLELSSLSGIYVKVTAPYSEGGRDYKVGEELFITGDEQMIYQPRAEHALIRYGKGKEVHHAIAIPNGEARYVLDRETGDVGMVKGPMMFLPDPRKEVVVKRILDRSQVSLWFPVNDRAYQYNESLRENEGDFEALEGGPEIPRQSMLAQTASTKVRQMADEFVRGTGYTPPRTITLDTKYDGVVTVEPWTGYAIQVVNKEGTRRVVQGPATCLLGYDEILESLSLSTGKPKNTETLLNTVYLQVRNNIVTDIVTVETSDFCEVKLKLSYKVNFEGDPENWFNIKNYVKYLCDHLRSVLKSGVVKLGIEEFYGSSVETLRDLVLGEKPEEGERTGKLFEENGMRIYDVEVLMVEIQDRGIQDMLVQAQQAMVRATITKTMEKREFEAVQAHEEIARQKAQTLAETEELRHKLHRESAQREHLARVEDLKHDADLTASELAEQLNNQEILDDITKAEVGRDKLSADQRIAEAREDIQNELARLAGVAEADVRRLDAVSPQLTAALTALSDASLMSEVAQHLAPLSIVKGQNFSQVLSSFFEGTPLEDTVKKLAVNPLEVQTTQG